MASVDDRRIAAGLFFLAFVTYAYFFNGGGWNQNAHFDLTRAVVEHCSIRIDPYESNTGDKSYGRQSYLFANKPPGASSSARFRTRRCMRSSARCTCASRAGWR